MFSLYSVESVSVQLWWKN